MKIKVRMKKLLDPQAHFVSLVSRSANQIPFRIQKTAEGAPMIDLTNPRSFLSKILKGESTAPEAPAAPSVGAVIVHKTADLDAVKEVIKKAGFSVDTMTENADGTVMFAQGEAPEEGHVVRLSDQMVVVMKGFEPWSQKLSTFSEKLGATAYTEGFYAASSALRSVIDQSVYAATSFEEAKLAAEGHLADFTAHVMGLVASIPGKAFYANAQLGEMAYKTATPSATNCETIKKEETVMSDTEKTEEKVVEVVATAPTSDVVVVETPADAPAPSVHEAITSETPVPESVEKAAKKKEEEKAKEEVAPTTEAPVAEEGKAPPFVKEETDEEKAKKAPVKKEEALPDPVLEMLTKLSGQMSEITTIQKSQGEKIEALVTENSTLKTQVSEAVQKADATQKVVKSTVIAPAPIGDPSSKVAVSKADEGSEFGTGYYDSALMGSRVARNKKNS